MRISRKGAFAVGLVTAVTLTSGTAYAANGGSLLLGRSNAATLPTGLANSAGTPLALTARAGYAPLTVNSGTKVTNLNADTVDGVTSGSFALTTGRTGFIVGQSGDPDGYVNTATCPAGTVGVGGGGFAIGEYDSLWYTGPNLDYDGKLIPNSWAAGAEWGAVAWVNCYNPRGAVPGASSYLPTASASSGPGLAADKPLRQKALR
jgi:hypothetical protein